MAFIVGNQRFDTQEEADAYWNSLPQQQPTPSKSSLTSIPLNLWKGLGEGITYGIPEMVGQALKYTVAPETGQDIVKWAEENQMDTSILGTGDRLAYQIGSMLGPSIIPYAGTAKLARGLLGVGKAVKAANAFRAVSPAIQGPVNLASALQKARIASGIGSGATGALFGLAEAGRVKTRAEETGVEPGMAPIVSGLVEGLGEVAGTHYLGKLLGLGADTTRAAAKAGLVSKDALRGLAMRNLLKTGGVEAGTEFGQQLLEAYNEQLSGIRPTAQPWEEAKETIAPALGMTLLTGGLAGGLNKMAARRAPKEFPIVQENAPLTPPPQAPEEPVAPEPEVLFMAPENAKLAATIPPGRGFPKAVKQDYEVARLWSEGRKRAFEAYDQFMAAEEMDRKNAERKRRMQGLVNFLQDETGPVDNAVKAEAAKFVPQTGEFQGPVMGLPREVPAENLALLKGINRAAGVARNVGEPLGVSPEASPLVQELGYQRQLGQFPTRAIPEEEVQAAFGGPFALPALREGGMPPAQEPVLPATEVAQEPVVSAAPQEVAEPTPMQRAINLRMGVEPVINLPYEEQPKPLNLRQMIDRVMGIQRTPEVSAAQAAANVFAPPVINLPAGGQQRQLPQAPPPPALRRGGTLAKPGESPWEKIQRVANTPTVPNVPVEPTTPPISPVMPEGIATPVEGESAVKAKPKPMANSVFSRLGYTPAQVKVIQKNAHLRELILKHQFENMENQEEGPNRITLEEITAAHKEHQEKSGERIKVLDEQIKKTGQQLVAAERAAAKITDKSPRTLNQLLTAERNLLNYSQKQIRDSYLNLQEQKAAIPAEFYSAVDMAMRRIKPQAIVEPPVATARELSLEERAAVNARYPNMEVENRPLPPNKEGGWHGMKGFGGEYRPYTQDIFVPEQATPEEFLEALEGKEKEFFEAQLPVWSGQKESPRWLADPKKSGLNEEQLNRLTEALRHYFPDAAAYYEPRSRMERESYLEQNVPYLKSEKDVNPENMRRLAGALLGASHEDARRGRGLVTTDIWGVIREFMTSSFVKEIKEARRGASEENAQAKGRKLPKKSEFKAPLWTSNNILRLMLGGMQPEEAKKYLKEFKATTKNIEGVDITIPTKAELTRGMSDEQLKKYLAGRKEDIYLGNGFPIEEWVKKFPEDYQRGQVRLYELRNQRKIPADILKFLNADGKFIEEKKGLKKNKAVNPLTNEGGYLDIGKIYDGLKNLGREVYHDGTTLHEDWITQMLSRIPSEWGKVTGILDGVYKDIAAIPGIKVDAHLNTPTNVFVANPDILGMDISEKALLKMVEKQHSENLDQLYQRIQEKAPTLTTPTQAQDIIDYFNNRLFQYEYRLHEMTDKKHLLPLHPDFLEKLKSTEEGIREIAKTRYAELVASGAYRTAREAGLMLDEEGTPVNPDTGVLMINLQKSLSDYVHKYLSKDVDVRLVESVAAGVRKEGIDAEAMKAAWNLRKVPEGAIPLGAAVVSPKDQRRLIFLSSMDITPENFKKVIGHEIMEVILKMLPEKHLLLLQRDYPGTKSIAFNERVSDFFGEVLAAEKSGKKSVLKSGLQGVVDYIKNIIARVRNWRDNYGFVTSRDIFRDIQRGRYVEVDKKLLNVQPSVAFLLAGENALNPNKGRTRAEAMETYGDDPETIWRETGWVRGVDSKWRFEISDNSMLMKISETPALQEMELQDTITHDELFRQYPVLKFLPVKFADLGDQGVKGEYSEGNFELRLNSTYPWKKGQMRGTILHEVQHAVQDIENFAKGGSIQQFMDGHDLSGFQAAIAEYSSAQRVLDLRQLLNSTDGGMDAVKQNPDILNRVVDYYKEANGMTPTEEEIQKALNPSLDMKTVASQMLGAKDKADTYKAVAQAMHDRLAGEVEAEDTLARLGYSEEKRALTIPYSSSKLTKDAWIIQMQAPGVAMSLSHPQRVIDDPIVSGVPGGWSSTEERTKPTVDGLKAKAKELWNHIYANYWDNRDPIKRWMRDALGDIDIEGIAAHLNPYKMFRTLTPRILGWANAALEYKTYDVENFEETGLGLAPIISPVVDAGNMEYFKKYLVAAHEIEIAKRENPRTEKRMLTGFTPEQHKNARLMAEKYKDMKVYGNKTYDEVAREVADFNGRVFRNVYKTGIISQGTYEKIVSTYAYYVPWYRIMEDTKGMGQGKATAPYNPIKRQFGGKGEVDDVIANIMKNVYMISAQVQKNETNKVFVKFLEKNQQKFTERGITPVVTEIDAPLHVHGVSLEEALKNDEFRGMMEFLEGGDISKERRMELKKEMFNIFRPNLITDPSVLTVFEKGKPRYFRVSNPDLVQAIKGSDPVSGELVTKLAGLPAQWLRIGATIVPEFFARNIFRDQTSAYIYSKYGYNPSMFLNGMKDYFSKSDLYYKALLGGGEYATLASMDINALKSRYTEILAKNRASGLLGEGGYKDIIKSLVTFKTPIKALQMISEVGEMGTRMGEFKAAMNAQPGRSTKEKILESSYAMREVTLDFQRKGAKMKAVTSIIAFMNPALQGTDKTLRMMMSKDLNTRYAGILRAVTTITIPSILLALATDDDDRVKEVPQWERDLFWIVPTENNVYRIPKPFEIGMIFGSSMERVLHLMKSDDPEGYEGFKDSLFRGIFPNYFPTAALPFFEMWANKSYFTNRPIVPRGKENLKKEFQYTHYTTETAKQLGALLGNIPVVSDWSIASPAVIENFIRGWFGGAGVHVLKGLDSILGVAVPDSGAPKPPNTLADIPLIKAFVSRYPTSNSESITRFFDNYQLFGEVKNSYNNLLKQGKDVEAEEFLEKSGGFPPNLENYHTAIERMYRYIDGVYNAPDVTPDEKRQLIDNVYLDMMEVAREGNNSVKEWNAEKSGLTL